MKILILLASALLSFGAFADDDQGAVNADESVLMESHFQALFNGQAPEQEMIDYIDQLYTLLIETNKGIDTFDKELDTKLAIVRKVPGIKVEEPLASPTYKKLLKLWQLRDAYQDEIGYFYLRLMQTRTDDTLPLETKRKARTMQQNISSFLKNMVDLKRVELQPLMEELRDVFEAFVVTYKEEQRTKRPGYVPGNSDPNAPEEVIVPPSFNAAIFGSQAELEAYIRSHRKVPALPNTPAEKRRQADFLKKIDLDLGLLPEPVEHDNADSAFPVQNLTPGGGRKIYSDIGTPGNIIGANFPSGVWAFTFDDGPARQSTSDMIDALTSFHDSLNPVGKGTFFWLAKNVNSFPNWVRKAHDSGYPFENHSFTHADLARQSSAGRAHEIFDANAVLTAAYQKVAPGYVIQYFRCPYGSCFAPKVPEARAMIAKLKEVHVYWRIDSLDWKLLNGPKVAALVEKQMQILNHGVILMHDIHPTTVGALKLVLAWMKGQNDSKKAHYKMVTIPEAVDLVNGTN